MIRHEPLGLLARDLRFELRMLREAEAALAFWRAVKPSERLHDIRKLRRDVATYTGWVAETRADIKKAKAAARRKARQGS